MDKDEVKTEQKENQEKMEKTETADKKNTE